ncbi:hypothetical protein QOZ80_5BG0453200 [Eleusine coracana subsp. coracana]|nr:hypothetical protein QOZ80_5BG0453200 [Eleusine coracana subsp. coracana]
MSTTKSSSRRPPRTGAARRAAAHILLNVTAVVGIHSNRTSATSLTRNKVPISVSFLFQRPPQLSTVFVHSSDLHPNDPPEIVRSVDDLVLLRVNVSRFRTLDGCDYFIYRAHPRRPSLALLQRPHPFIQNCTAGLLPRPDGQYTVAALVATGVGDFYELHLFHSDTASSGWSTRTLSMPQQRFPVEIPRKCDRLLCHHTTTVITIGGKLGTMGWVDLWRGILLCDLLDPNPALRVMPLPLPLEKIRANNGLGVYLGYPGDYRGISFIREKCCFKFVHMEVIGDRIGDDENGMLAFRVDDWKITTWNNTEMRDSLDDWYEGVTVKASEITIDHDPAVSQALENSGLLCKPHYTEEATAGQQGLQNLSTYQPIPCARGEDVVYLMVRKKFMHPMAWMLAVEMKDRGRLRAVACSGQLQRKFLAPMYCSSTISKYLNPNKLKKPATVPVDMSAEESDQAGGLENPNTI